MLHVDISNKNEFMETCGILSIWLVLCGEFSNITSLSHKSMPD